MDQQPQAPVNSNQQTAAPQPTLPNVPDVWPGGFGIYKYSKQAVKRNVRAIILLYAISILVAVILGAALGVVGRLIGDIVSIVVTVALVTTFIASVRGQKLSVGDALKKNDAVLILKYFANSILVLLICAVSLLLFIVPYFFVLPRVILAPYFVIDKKLGPIEAIKASWAVTRGHSKKIWGVFIATFVMALLFVTIIGIPFAIYFLLMYSAATAVVYEFVTKSQPAPAPAAVTPAPADTPVAAPPAA